MHSTFFVVFVVGLLAVISPGPDFLVVSRNSLLHSKRVGIATALGIATGNIWWIGTSVVGISYLIAKTVLLFSLLKWAGALYLIYLGVGALRSKGMVPASEQTAVVKMSTMKAFRTGLLTNLLNPKCALFFVSFFSLVITPETPAAMRWTYGLEITMIAIIWFSLVATVLSTRKVKLAFQNFSVWFDRITGALLIALGIKVALLKTSE